MTAEEAQTPAAPKRVRPYLVFAGRRTAASGVLSWAAVCKVCGHWISAFDWRANVLRAIRAHVEDRHDLIPANRSRVRQDSWVLDDAGIWIQRETEKAR